ncbi:MAG: imidazole glycerol phosphate synthase cyclase subunit [Sterolibacteriaceae bacterium MAG5]|nr:imidazole glycerol phosphate synthase cyclase subunit [Candidatus Nitricoxidireducens bremensis]
MHKTRVIPVVLLTGYNVVKSIQFKTYRTIGNPVAVARVYDARNVDELILLDIRASPEERMPACDIVSDITSECFMPLTVGGGVKSVAHAEALLRSGADKIAINSGGLADPSLIKALSREFGAQCVVVSIDAVSTSDGYLVATDGARQTTTLDARDWARKCEALGAGEILLTSVEKDGTMSGYDLDLVKAISASVRIPVIASGGAGLPSHCVGAISSGAAAVAAASMFHFTKITPQEVKEELQREGFPTRLA